MISFDEVEVGMNVVYVPQHVVKEKYTSDQVENGVVTSWNDTCIFVDYDGTGRGAATRPKDLFLREVIEAGKILVQ